MKLNPIDYSIQHGFHIFERKDGSRFEVECSEEEYKDLSTAIVPPNIPDGCAFIGSRLTPVIDGTFIDWGNGKTTVKLENQSELLVKTEDCIDGELKDELATLIAERVGVEMPVTDGVLSL